MCIDSVCDQLCLFSGFIVSWNSTTCAKSLGCSFTAWLPNRSLFHNGSDVLTLLILWRRLAHITFKCNFTTASPPTPQLANPQAANLQPINCARLRVNMCGLRVSQHVLRVLPSPRRISFRNRPLAPPSTVAYVRRRVCIP